ncbi:hypothetical protein J1614_011195 [Plenodomus biglobosus]|nr:hypothetical protein J1614_011195 [Plenodomus biglobosus]
MANGDYFFVLSDVDEVDHVGGYAAPSVGGGVERLVGAVVAQLVRDEVRRIIIVFPAMNWNVYKVIAC